MTAIALSLLAALGFGSASVLVRSALLGIPLLSTVWLSLLVSFAITAVFVSIFAIDDLGSLSAVALLWIAALGVVQVFGGRAQNYMAVGMIGASRASLFFATQAPFGALFAIVFLEESISLPVIIGTAAVVAGLLAASGDSLLAGWRTGRLYLLGYLVALSAGAAYGGTNVVFKKASEQLDSPLMITAISMLVGIVLLAPVAAASSARDRRRVRAFDRSRLKYVALAGLASGIGINAMYFALQRADVVIVTPIVSSSPLVTLLLAHLFIARLEQVTPRLVVGVLLAVVGVIAVSLGGQL